MGMTISEKILARAAGLPSVRPGEIVECAVDLAMTHEGTAAAAQKFFAMGGSRVWDPGRIASLLDHWAPAHTERIAGVHSLIRSFVAAQGIKNFYDIKEGICHQVIPEKGHVRPGWLIVGTDSHTTTYGAFGAFATGVGVTDMAAVYLDGRIWLKVPPTIRFVIEGGPAPHVTSKDVMLYLLGRFGTEYATYKAVEFAGGTVRAMSVSSRMTLANMAVEMGAKAGIVAPDDKTLDWLEPRLGFRPEAVINDTDAAFELEIGINAGEIEIQVACPHSPGNSVPIHQVAGRPINQAFLGSCTNGRLEDLAAAVAVMGGRPVAPGVRMIVIPASREIYREAMRMGYIQALSEAGAVICNPTCGAYIGAQMGLLAPGEVCIASSNRNFKGRMGSQDAEVYLASPAVVAASAVAGVIAGPEEVSGK